MNKVEEYHNLWGAARGYYTLKKKKKGIPQLIVVSDVKSFEVILSDLKLFEKNIPILEFPQYLQEPFEEARVASHIMSARSKTLHNITILDDYIVVATVYSIFKKIPPKEQFISSELILIKDADNISRDQLEYFLDILGYIHVEFVTGEGEYNIRGGLVDIFPVNSKHPIRVEYFDNEIESIFSYNPESQSREKSYENIKILPASELLFSTDEFINKLKDPDIKEKAKNYGKFAGYHWYAPLVTDSLDTIFDYLPKDIDLIFYKSDWKDYLKEFENLSKRLLFDKKLPELFKENFISYYRLEALLDSYNKNILTEVTDSILSISTDFYSTKNMFTFEKSNIYQSMNSSMIIIKELLEEDNIVIVSIESEKFFKIFNEFMRDYNFIIKKIDSIKEVFSSGLYLYPHRISGGFIDKKDKIVCISDVNLFGFSRRKSKTKKKKAFNTSISDLEDGDYIVHVNHGVGIYRGIKHLTIAGVEGDYLDLLYDGDDILYVPLQAIGQIQKYIGFGDQKPKLSSLKSSTWSKLKKYAKDSAKSIAEDLLRLYAERKSRKGYAFTGDNLMVEEFESDFEYDETEDQLSSILDVYKDMENDTPMERLVCGDVGFGKTEVAMRSACKAVACGKQVAVLVPTTILARQHYKTFKYRFRNFPVNIEFISRYKTDKEYRDIIKKVFAGQIDIIIGTHKLLAKDIIFKDLGLLIIDEEQRFGVSHKEKIAAIKRDVDTLVLSATPIPRTLQLSLSGIRDMSIIETPPENRLPVIVKVIKGDSDIVKAIEYELERDGQVFFLNNQVNNIQEIASNLKNLIPSATVDFAHGQMSSTTLEKVLQKFYSGKVDILVSTTIIENGVDIPNVNTIIINNAGNFGLSQLYQLKGRVGRSNRRGYCYLAVDNFALLSSIAQKRLSIIQQLSDLGSGFKIAMYDLQLRGAGNILGAEQSGFAVKVGYELYVRMIGEAVHEIKGEYSNSTDTEINSSIAYFIPADYIEDPKIRFDFYRSFSEIYDKELMNKLLKEIELAYGELREELINLGYIMLIKNIAAKIGIVKVNITKLGAKIQFSKDTKINPIIISKIIEKDIKYRFTSEFELSLAVANGKILQFLTEFFEQLYVMSY